MAASIYAFSNYKAFLNERVRTGPKAGRGMKKAMAEIAGCQTAYLSRVFNPDEDAHLSWEQAEAIARYLDLGLEEKRYFLLLVQHARAGTRELRAHVAGELDQLKQRHLELANRLPSEQRLSEEDQSVYFGSWIHAAIHTLLTIPGQWDVPRISRQLGLPAQDVSSALEFLLTKGLAAREGSGYKTGRVLIHLGRNSPHLRQHHTQWRLKAVGSLDRPRAEDLHYTAVFTVSRADYERLREDFVKQIEAAVALIGKSAEEKLCAIGVDLFEV